MIMRWRVLAYIYRDRYISGFNKRCCLVRFHSLDTRRNNINVQIKYMYVYIRMYIICNICVHTNFVNGCFTIILYNWFVHNFSIYGIALSANVCWKWTFFIRSMRTFEIHACVNNEDWQDEYYTQIAIPSRYVSSSLGKERDEVDQRK